MNSHSTPRFGGIALGVAVSALALAACSPQPTTEKADAPAAEATTAAPTEATAAPAAPAATAVAPDNVDTVSGAKFASFTGDAAKGEATFAACKVCHAVELGANKIGPSLHGLIGRKAGEIAGYTYSAANKNSGITWTAEKMFQYLEGPQHITPGTKMSYPGLPDPQKRADVIAYLATQK